jgi:hypothetical protein
MSSKANAATNASVRRGNGSMDEAMKAGIVTTVCSVFILAIVFLAMQTLPVGGIG